VAINLLWKLGILFEAATTPRRERYEEGAVPSPSDYGIWGSIINFFNWVRGIAMAENKFGALWAQQYVSDRQKTSKWSTAWTATHLDVKLGQIRDRVRNSGQFSVLNDLIFFRDRPSKFGIVPKNSVQMVTLDKLGWFCKSIKHDKTSSPGTTYRTREDVTKVNKELLFQVSQHRQNMNCDTHKLKLMHQILSNNALNSLI